MRIVWRMLRPRVQAGRRGVVDAPRPPVGVRHVVDRGGRRGAYRGGAGGQAGPGKRRAPRAERSRRAAQTTWTLPFSAAARHARRVGVAPSTAIAVGTAVAGGPPRRSQRALLTHWAPALGSGVEALVGPGMQDAGGWEPSIGEAVASAPRSCRERWLRRRSARRQCRMTCSRKARARRCCRAPRSRRQCPRTTLASQRPCSGMGRCRRRISSALTALSLAASAS